MSMDMIRGIRETEEQADNILKQAHQKAREILRKAEGDGALIVSEAIRKAREEGFKMMAKAEDEAKREIKRLEAQNEQECAAVREVSKRNMDKAVAFVLGRIVKADGHN